SQNERKDDRASSHKEALEYRIPDRVIGEKLAVPIEGEMTRGKTSDAITIERIKDQHDDGQVNEGKHERGIESKERGAPGWGVGIHLKAQRFSRNSLKKRRET